MRFSERHGFVPIRDALQLAGMDDSLRNSLWNALRIFCFAQLDNYKVVKEHSEADMLTAIMWAHFLKKQLDVRPFKARDCLEELREWFSSCEWYEAYDMVEFALENLFEGHEVDKRNTFERFCNTVLEREHAGYRIIGDEISPITSETEITEIEEAQSQAKGFQSVSTHLETALRLLSDRTSPDYRNSIKESISAVESMCCLLAEAPKASLGDALKKLERRGVALHGALKEAFEKLYGYTSDADGIRHKLLADPKLDFDDAKFMLVACSAFVNYLKSKGKA